MQQAIPTRVPSSTLQAVTHKLLSFLKREWARTACMSKALVSRDMVRVTIRQNSECGPCQAAAPGSHVSAIQWITVFPGRHLCRLGHPCQDWVLGRDYYERMHCRGAEWGSRKLTGCCPWLAPCVAAALRWRLQNGLIQGELVDEVDQLHTLFGKVQRVNPAHKSTPHCETLDMELCASMYWGLQHEPSQYMPFNVVYQLCTLLGKAQRVDPVDQAETLRGTPGMDFCASAILLEEMLQARLQTWSSGQACQCLGQCSRD